MKYKNVLIQIADFVLYPQAMELFRVVIYFTINIHCAYANALSLESCIVYITI